MNITRLAAAAVMLFATTLKSEVDSLVNAEKAFAQLSLLKGTRDAFLANLNEGSILFRPEVVPGKAWMEKSPPSTSQLSWAPEFADIATSADLGYTTGPWELKRTPQEPAAAFGHYVTVWRRQTDGAWKIAIDIGVAHTSVPKPARVEIPQIASSIQKRRSDAEIQRARNRMLQLERDFHANADAYSNLFATDARLYRNNNLPFVGQPSIRRQLASAKRTITWTVIDADVAGSAEFGFAYGTALLKSDGSPDPAEKANYLRIWRVQKNGDWKIVLDLVS